MDVSENGLSSFTPATTRAPSSTSMMHGLIDDDRCPWDLSSGHRPVPTDACSASRADELIEFDLATGRATSIGNLGIDIDQRSGMGLHQPAHVRCGRLR